MTSGCWPVRTTLARRLVGATWVLLTVLLLLLLPARPAQAQVSPAAPAAAPTSEACVAAYTASQELRLEGKIGQSRERASFCAQELCPSAVVSSCTKWLTDLRDAQPTISIGARLANGNDITDVVTEIDGIRVGDTLTGAPIELDPGKHSMVFTHGALVQKMEILVSEGIKNRPIVVVFTPPETIEDAPKSKPQPAPIAPERPGAPAGAFVLGGVGIAAVGVFGVLAGIGTFELNDLRDTCGVTHTCPADFVEETKTKLIVGDVFLAVGTVAVASSVIWLIVHYAAGEPEPQTSALVWSLSPVQGGAYGAISARY